MKTITCPHCSGLVELTGLMSDIREFHRKFEQEYVGPPRMLDPDAQDFRQNFMQEELDEYYLAVQDEDHDKALDSLVDLVYVALGTAHLHGYPFVAAWRNVHEKNMQKILARRAEDSARGYKYDVIKLEGWTPPDHTSILRAAEMGQSADLPSVK